MVKFKKSGKKFDERNKKRKVFESDPASARNASSVRGKHQSFAEEGEGRIMNGAAGCVHASLDAAERGYINSARAR